MASNKTRLWAVVGIIGVGLGAYACGGGSPAGPTPSDPAPRAKTGDGTASSSNEAPVLEFRTTPRHVNNEIFGQAPLQVKINTCNSSDPDPGDSIRTDVDWGDQGIWTGPGAPGAGTDPEDEGNPATGCGGPDCCRHRHEYKDPGRYTIKVHLTDKHLEDQGQDLESLALTTATLTARVGEDQQIFHFGSGDVPQFASSFGTLTSNLTVSGVGGSVGDVDASLHATTNGTVANTTVTLTGPTGATSTLAMTDGTPTSQNWGNNCADRTGFDDQAGTPISAATTSFAGGFRPTSPLSAFNGLNPNGTWQLQMVVSWQTTLQCWGVSITAN